MVGIRIATILLLAPFLMGQQITGLKITGASIGGVVAGGGMLVLDTFNDGGSTEWTDEQGTGTHDGAEVDHSGSVNAMRWSDNAMDTVNHCVKWEASKAGSSSRSGALLRTSDPHGDYYAFWCDNALDKCFFASYNTTSEQASTSLAHPVEATDPVDAGDWGMACVTGLCSDASTRAWLWFSDTSDPDPSLGAPDIDTNWGLPTFCWDETGDCDATVQLSIASGTGTWAAACADHVEVGDYLGLRSWNASSTGNFAGGDFSEFNFTPATVPEFVDTFARTTDPNNDVDADNVGMSGKLVPWAITELEETGACEIRIDSGELEYIVNGDSACDFKTGLARLDDALSVDQWIAIKIGSRNGWGGGAGWGAAVRMHSDADGGLYYQFSCDGVDCNDVRLGIGDGPSFLMSISDDFDCDAGDGWTTTAENEWVGFSVRGAGESTVWEMWDFASTSDPGHYDTWVAPTCSLTMSPNAKCADFEDPIPCCVSAGAGTCEIDDGTFISPRFYTGDGSDGDTLGIVEIKAGNVP